MNILIIPEDSRRDKDLLLPIFEKMFNTLGKPKARVRVLSDPILGGIGEALKWERLKEIIDERKGMTNLFLLCVDRDGEPNRRERLDKIELKAKEVLSGDRLFLAENAWQELEVWLLAGHSDLPKAWNWSDIRTERDPKEIYFLPFAKLKGVINQQNEGRKKLSEQADYNRISKCCPEVRSLEDRIKDWLQKS
jgi:hypothetical protein